jgi:Na+-transporting methylmalonyl-CoA/oxaloacetate decarboxylase gamma subunit
MALFPFIKILVTAVEAVGEIVKRKRSRKSKQELKQELKQEEKDFLSIYFFLLILGFLFLVFMVWSMYG